MTTSKDHTNNAPFNEVYKSSDLYYGEVPSEELIEFLNQEMLPKSASVLELGCGEGRDTFFLAQKGHSVLALDIASTAINKLIARAKELGLSLQAQCQDIMTFAFPVNSYDLVVADTILDQFHAEDTRQLIGKVKGSVKVGGLVFVRDFSAEDPGFTHEGKASATAYLVKHYFRTDEIAGYFSDWTVLRNEQKLVKDESHGPPHQHGIIVLVARKPAA